MATLIILALAHLIFYLVVCLHEKRSSFYPFILLWKNPSYYIWLFLRTIFFAFKKISFLVIIIISGYAAFSLVDQGKDMMIGFAKPFEDFWIIWYWVFFLVFSFLWAMALWFAARFVLISADLTRIIQVPGFITRREGNEQTIVVDNTYESFMKLLNRWLPRYLIMWPYLIFIAGILSVNKKISTGMMMVTLIFSVTAILHLRAIITRRKWQGVKEEKKKELEPVKSFKEVSQSDGLRNFLVALFVLAFFSVMLCWMAVTIITPSQNGMPGLVILIAFFVYTMMALILDYVSNRMRFPVVVLLGAFILLIALKFNNNHELDYVYENGKPVKIAANARLTDKEYFKQWMSYRLDNKVDYFHKGDTIPVIIIASEGGGIRACFWTVNVLNSLYDTMPMLYNNTFAGTGASGGSVGLGFFYNYLYSLQQENKGIDKNTFSDSSPIFKISSADFLSAVSFGFTFPDMAQRFIPWKIKSFDRGKFLGNSFSRSFEDYSGFKGKNILNEAYMTQWQTQDAYRYPVLLFNSSYVEQGQKAVFSPFSLSEDYYPDVLDILGRTRVMMKMKEGMVSTARFPAITPPGLMYYYDADTLKKFGHLVDGGTFENTAIQTAEETAIMINQTFQDLKNDPAFSQKLGKKYFKPVIISIRFGSDGHGDEPPLGAGYEASPLIGGYKILFRWIDGVRATNISQSKDRFIDHYLFSLRPQGPYYIKKGNDSIKYDVTLPLGWYLSDISEGIIINETKNLKVPDEVSKKSKIDSFINFMKK